MIVSELLVQFVLCIFILQLVKEPLLYIWSHGMLTFLSFWNSGRIMGRYPREITHFPYNIVWNLLIHSHIMLYFLFVLFQEEHRARDLFYGLWIPDLFMERVQSDGQWSLFCPNEAPGLADCWGTDFERLYTQYEKEVSDFIFGYTTSLSEFKLLHNTSYFLIHGFEPFLVVFIYRVRLRKLSRHSSSGTKS